MSKKLRSLIPNLVTLTGLCFGLSSIRFALEGDYNLAVICILFAAACDGLDGMLARYLKSESELGVQLDSLSDFLSFRMCLSTSSTPLFSATARWMASYLSGGARSKTVATISQWGNFRSHGMTL